MVPAQSCVRANMKFMLQLIVADHMRIRLLVSVRKDQLLPPANAAGIVSGCVYVRACVCLSICPVRAPTFLKATKNLHFWYAGKSCDYIGLVGISRSSGQVKGHTNKRSNECN